MTGVHRSLEHVDARLRRLRRRPIATPLGLASLGLVLNLAIARSNSVTMDEPFHLRYGAAILHGATSRELSIFFDSKMPVSAFNAAPAVISTILRKHGWPDAVTRTLEDVRTARFPTIAASFLLSLIVYSYTASLYGRIPGLFAQLLLILSPTITAHSTLATTDLYVSLGAVAFLYCLRRFLLYPGTNNAILVAATLGFAQLTKFSGAYLYIVLAMVLASVAWFSKYSGQTGYHISFRRMAVLLTLTVICFVVFVNAGFVFDRTFTPLARYQFSSLAFQALQRVPLLRSLPLPLPYAYVEGLDVSSYNNSHEVSFGNITLLGEVRGKQLARSDGFLSYYLVAYVLKEPLGMQLLLLLGIVWVTRRRSLAGFLAAEGPLVTTVIVFFAVFSFSSNTQIGIRHILPALVVFVILSGAAFASWQEASRWRKGVLAACLLYTAISVGSHFPYLIPYFNEIVWDRKMAYRYLADSNLDWSQDAHAVAQFRREHAGVLVDPPNPVVGWVLVRANLMAGVYPPKADYWLRFRNLKPVGHVGYAHLLFVVPP
jgi:4-amino-4-deoxy-L-arabinose transferase-like glycosyltransferase